MPEVADDNVFDSAHRCLVCSDPAAKVESTFQFASAVLAGTLDQPACRSIESMLEPGRPTRPNLVAPRQLASRGLGSADGRAALVHAVAHIEFNAINLALDAIYRFRDMPTAYYADWASIAADEARHFSLLSARLEQLGFAYGDFDAHDGLWDMAMRTRGSCLERMALVPRVLEARGLDVTPGMIERLRHVGDLETTTILETILAEEVAHVAAGSRWFAWCCEREGVDAEETFRNLLDVHVRGSLRGPFNVEARLLAGFSREEIARLEAAAA
ncbi:MAG: ferritin-like domain-containing protein [Dokdonella sp.]|uniref:ferritin-like domain-containing protein n=1 Tax=Dokdonella sp. TaxID=2291710 RepID=UPI003265DCB5